MVKDVTHHDVKQSTKPKRVICSRCNRPTPSACICPSLPNEPIPPFQKCRVIVLQHPHELRRKNRSLPLIELCLSPNGKDLPRKDHSKLSNHHENDPSCSDDFIFQTVVGRRLGEQTPRHIMKFIQNSNNALLFYPDENSVTLKEGLELLTQRQIQSQTNISNESIKNFSQGTIEPHNNDRNNDKVTLIFIDATWKYAKEMIRKNNMFHLWPKDLIHVKLCTPNMIPSTVMVQDLNPENHKPCTMKLQEYEEILPNAGLKPNREIANRNTTAPKINMHTNQPISTLSSISSEIQTFPKGYRPCRFDIRSPPSDNHLSTAECIAWVVSAIENDCSIYETFMKPLDYMVNLWHSFDNCNNSKETTCLS